MPVDLFIDVENRAINAASIDAGTSSFASMQIGEGSKVFRGDQSGIWLGASEWADAPFRVNMEGALWATSLIISGYIPDGGAAADVNANAVTIDADMINISGATTFSSGYDPTDKVDELAGTYNSAASGARVRIFPDANTGLQIIDNSANNVFLAYVGGTDVGDIIIGDYAGGSGVKWDKSASKMLIRGDMDAGTITGVTIKTASTGVRVELTASDAEIALYDSGNDKALSIDDTGTRAKFAALDGRDVELSASGGDVYCEDTFRVDTIDENGAGFVDINDDLNVGGWFATDSWASLGGDLDMNKNDINEIGSLAYACAVYTGDGKLAEILKTLNPKYPHIDSDYGVDWKKMNHKDIHNAIKANWTKKKPVKQTDGKMKLEESPMIGYALEKVVLIQNQLILKMEERIKVLEGV